MKFTKEFLLRIIFDDYEDGDDIKIMQNEIVDVGRWTITHSIVFKHQDKYFTFCYDEPATEMQEGCGYFEFYDDDDIIEEVYEVHPVEKTVIVYE